LLRLRLLQDESGENSARHHARSFISASLSIATHHARYALSARKNARPIMWWGGRDSGITGES
ncbi:MAG: hypothetical protein RSD95_15945, partial [Clostridia bacterium]